MSKKAMRTFRQLVVGTLIGIAVVVTVFISGGIIYELTKDEVVPTTLTHTVDGKKFEIPLAYVEWHPWGDIGEDKYWSLEAMLPDFAPYLKENDQSLNDSTTGSTESIAIQIFDPKLLSIFVPLSWTDAEIRNRCVDDRDGAMICGYWVDEERIVLLKETRRYEFECDTWKSGPIPGCRGEFPMLDNVVFRVSFARQYLAQTEQIIAQAYQKICSFYRPSSDDNLTFNYCKNGIYF